MPMIEVSGKVAKSIQTQTGKGIVKFWEKSNFKGNDKFVLWTAWFEQPMLHIGENDEITISGRLSTKISTYTNKDGEEKTGVEHHLNDSAVMKHVGIGNTLTPAFTADEEVPF
jgi:hypothetical protein